MIALPFQGAPPPPDGFDFRVLMNQYDEELKFTFVDANVPNRGLTPAGGSEHDQFVVTLDYQQQIAQTVAEDLPESGEAGPPGLPIHHEAGLWLYMRNLRPEDSEGTMDVARLSTIPHGNSVLALGASEVHDKMPDIPAVSGLPLGPVDNKPYLAPFQHYIDHPFKGTVTAPGFPGFSPADMNVLLRLANEGVDIVRTTTLTVDSTRDTGGIVNAPFSVREAEAVTMKATFWIQELAETDHAGNPKLRLQYSQVVMLDFFRPRGDQLPGRVAWPHISINTLEKVPGDYELVAS